MVERREGEGRPVMFRLGGHDLAVTDKGDRWHVRLDEREAEDRYLDHALARVLDRPPGSVLHLVAKILRSEPGSELDP